MILTVVWLLALMLAGPTAAAHLDAADITIQMVDWTLITPPSPSASGLGRTYGDLVSVGFKVGDNGAAAQGTTKGDLGPGTPDVSACGSGATVTGGNTAGTITGIDPTFTTCTMLFSSPQAVVPVCVTSMISNAGGGVLVGATSKSSVTFTFQASTGLVIRYICTAPR